MDKRDRQLIEGFKNRLPSDIKKHLKQIIVFGSRIKGKSTEDSDIDVLVLLDSKTPEAEQKLEDIAYEVMWENDFNPIISLKVFSSEHFHHYVEKGFSFYQNIEREGIPI